MYDLFTENIVDTRKIWLFNVKQNNKPTTFGTSTAYFNWLYFNI